MDITDQLTHESRIALAAAAEITRLRAEVEALRADAERYRHLKANHLREYPDDNGTLCIEFWCDFDNWDDVDAAIDAARAAQGERG